MVPNKYARTPGNHKGEDKYKDWPRPMLTRHLVYYSGQVSWLRPDCINNPDHTVAGTAISAFFKLRCSLLSFTAASITVGKAPEVGAYDRPFAVMGQAKNKIYTTIDAS
jgi:hypothetical protein